MKHILISCIISLSCLGATELPQEVRELVEAREKEVHKIRLAYLKKLDSMLAKYRIAGETASAEMVEELIRKEEQGEKVDLADPGTGPLAALVGKWERDYDGSLWWFKDEKSGVYAGNTPFTMTYNPTTKKIVIVSAKWVNEISFTMHPDILRGEGAGKRYKLTRLD